MKQNASKSAVLIPIIAASTVGTLIEWYDFFIFGSLATIISAQFFPKENPTASFLATLATFAAGFVVRPFGALFFGRLGDIIGRKYTFMVTLVIMGFSTFAIGLVPRYETIGFFAPVVVLTLRLLQGLAIGGEYGGAATYVAEHAPENERGFWTSWIQITAPFAMAISISAIAITKSLMTVPNWESWGWRIPFLISVPLVGISIWMRKNMAESPLFAKAKVEGTTSVNPLKESFGKKENLKVVLVTLLGIMLGAGVLSWTSFYIQNFLLRIMSINFDQANLIVISGFISGLVWFIFFGWLSDRIGRKPLLLASFGLSLILLRPIFGEIYQTANLSLKTESNSTHNVTSNVSGTVRGTFEIPRTFVDSILTTTTQRYYTDGTLCQEIQKQTIGAGKYTKPETSKSITLSQSATLKIILMIFVMSILGGMYYGPLAAFLVELFPLKIRYTSISLPYHIGNGIYGGMAYVITTYLIGKAQAAHAPDYYLAGLIYPIVLTSISFIILLLYINETASTQFSIFKSTLKLNTLKRYLGIVWITLGLVAAYLGVFELGLPKLKSGIPDDFIFGIIMMIIIAPITAFSLITFGRYALNGEYDS